MLWQARSAEIANALQALLGKDYRAKILGFTPRRFLALLPVS
jgi:hypothetical protein